jgi:hypothetical protein
MWLGDGHLGTEHLWLGILGNQDGTASRMLGRLDVSPEMLEERLFELRGRAAGKRMAVLPKEGGHCDGCGTYGDPREFTEVVLGGRRGALSGMCGGCAEEEGC